MEDAIGRLHKYAEAAYRIIQHYIPAEDRAAVLTMLADLGAGARLAMPLLAALIDQESDDKWREDLLPFGMDWFRRILSANLGTHLDGVDDLTQDTEGHPLRASYMSNPEAYSHYRRSVPTLRGT